MNAFPAIYLSKTDRTQRIGKGAGILEVKHKRLTGKKRPTTHSLHSGNMPIIISDSIIAPFPVVSAVAKGFPEHVSASGDMRESRPGCLLFQRVPNHVRPNWRTDGGRTDGLTDGRTSGRKAVETHDSRARAGGAR